MNPAILGHMQPTIADFHESDDPFVYTLVAKELKNYYPKILV